MVWPEEAEVRRSHVLAPHEPLRCELEVARGMIEIETRGLGSREVDLECCKVK
jgi:hypothetical protein